MAKRKQKRRQQKARRHEWEYVYVDDAGNEVDVDPDELKTAKAAKAEQRARRTDTTKRGAQPGRRAGRTVEPPSWRRVGKRALMIGPVVVIAMFLLNRGLPVAQRIVPAVVMLAFFLPFSYFTDSLAYKMYRKRMDRTAKS